MSIAGKIILAFLGLMTVIVGLSVAALICLDRELAEAGGFDETLVRARESLLAIAIAAPFAAVTIGLLLARSIHRPLRGLERAARAVAEGRLEAVPERGPAEMRSLARTFNRMARTVVRARSTLETTVNIRTGDLVQANAALRASEERYRTLVEHAPEAIVVLDAGSGRFVDANENAVRLFKMDRPALRAASPESLSPPRQPCGRSSRRLAREYVDRTLAGENPVFEWVHRDSTGRELICEIRLVRLPHTRHLIRGSVTDISERKAIEVRQRLMTRELDHRVKNNLASVLALFEQTLASVATTEELRRRFTGRIIAMSRTHEALACRHWEGVDMGEAVRTVLEPFDAADGRIFTDGAAISLGPRIASPLGLALHELATNAARHGSLSSTRGRLEIKWRRHDRDSIRLSWLERGGPASGDPTRTGLGLALVRGLVEKEIGGTVAMRFDDAGLECELGLPIE